MKNTETITEQNYRLRQLAIKCAKERGKEPIKYIGNGIIKYIN